MNRILLADDDDELTEMLAQYFSNEGFNIDIANDGQIATHKSLNNNYDLIVLDVMMPEKMALMS